MKPQTSAGILAAFLLAAVAPLDGQTIHPQWSSVDGSIVLYERHGNSADIMILDADSGEKSPLLADGAYNANPSWSPDGRKLSFSSARPDMTGSWQLYVLDLETMQSNPFTDDASRKMHTSWSPDGAWIAFVRMSEGNSDVYLVSADGETEVQLTDTPEREFHPKWSADGQSVLFDSGPDDARLICVSDRASTEMNCIQPEKNWRVSTPSMSPDGSTIAFACADEEGGNICFMDPDGSRQRMSVDVAAGLDAGAPVFSPDGSRIAFHRGADGSYEIVILEIDSTR